MGQHRSNYAIT